MGRFARIALVMCDEGLSNDGSRLQEEIVTPARSLLENDEVDAVVFLGPHASEEAMLKIVSMTNSSIDPYLERVCALAPPVEMGPQELLEYGKQRGFPEATVVGVCKASSIPSTFH